MIRCEGQKAERLAAERAAKAQAEYEALMKSAEDLKRLHEAAPTMLAALQNLENDDTHIPESAWALVCAAIELATGETV